MESLIDTIAAVVEARLSNRKRKPESDGKEEKQVEKKQHIEAPPPYEGPPAAPIAAAPVVEYSADASIIHVKQYQPTCKIRRAVSHTNKIEVTLRSVQDGVLEGLKKMVVDFKFATEEQLTQAGYDTASDFGTRKRILEDCIEAGNPPCAVIVIVDFFRHTNGTRQIIPDAESGSGDVVI